MYPRSIKMKSLKHFHMNSNMFSKNYSLRLNPLLLKIFPIWVSDCSEQLGVLYFLSLFPCTKQPLWLITFLFITLSWNQRNGKHEKSGQPSRQFSYSGPPLSYRAVHVEVFQSHLNLLWVFFCRAMIDIKQPFSCSLVYILPLKTFLHHSWFDQVPFPSHLSCFCPMSFAVLCNIPIHAT